MKSLDECTRSRQWVREPHRFSQARQLLKQGGEVVWLQACRHSRRHFAVAIPIGRSTQLPETTDLIE